MSQRRWQAVAIAGTLGVAATVLGLAVSGKFSGGRPAAPVITASATEAAQSAMSVLADQITAGDTKALMTLCQTITPRAGQPSEVVVAPAEADDLIAVLKGLRAGYKSFAPAGRASAIAAAGRILHRFHVDPAPAGWVDALHPTHDLFNAGLADPHVDVRGSALNEVGHHWNWLPGRSMTPNEESILAEWKDAFVKPVTRCLGDPEPKSRAAAVVCLGGASLDSIAAPAVAYTEDPASGGVRYKALMVFANRPNLLTEDAVLKRLHDKEPGVPELAELILKGRGLTTDQIYLGRQMDDPRAENRASVIPLIRDRTDIDPTIWLIQLSHDTDETVRTKAAEALADRESPDGDRRLREMANSDTSPSVRSGVAKLVARLVKQTTAALPALPASATTSSSMSIRAN